MSSSGDGMGEMIRLTPEIEAQVRYYLSNAKHAFVNKPDEKKKM
jgi:hypothetical protein